MKYVIALALLLYGCGHYNGEHVWYRSIGGISNNLKHLNWGTAYAYLSRRTPNVYSDGIGQPSGGGRPSPREISNRLFVQEGDAPDEHGISDWAWQWGQFLDHDISLSEPVANDGEPFLIAIPTGDPIFDPQGKGGQWMPFVRSYHSVTGDSPQNPREQLNQVTSFIDASQVYGSDTTRDKTIRVGGADSLDPAPFLVSSNDTNQDGEYLLPRNVFHVANCSYGVQAKENLFLSGDVRTNEVPGLITIHTIFMREHNRVAKEYVTRFPQASNDTAFQYARKWLGGEMQVITYTEFLPALLGDLAPGLGGQYNPELDPGLSNEFTTVLFRFGHSMIPSTLARVDKSRRREASIPLHDAFFEPKWVSKSSDLDLIVRGLASQVSQRIDLKVVEPLRSYLFELTQTYGLDLAALNIQRGRDHGIPDYNTMRAAYGLPRVTEFSQITSNTTTQKTLKDLYGSTDNIDAWVGTLAEDHLPGASVGPLVAAGLIDAFTRLRDGDRFWFERDPVLTQSEVAELRATRLSTIVKRNTGATDLPNDLFHVIKR